VKCFFHCIVVEEFLGAYSINARYLDVVAIVIAILRSHFKEMLILITRTEGLVIAIAVYIVEIASLEVSIYLIGDICAVFIAPAVVQNTQLLLFLSKRIAVYVSLVEKLIIVLRSTLLALRGMRATVSNCYSFEIYR